MTITPAKLTRAAGFAALIAGLLYMFVQLIHPHEDVTQVVTTAWTVTHILTLLMAVFLVVGITGIYLRQVKEMGLLGFIGYLLFATWSLARHVLDVRRSVRPARAGRRGAAVRQRRARALHRR